MNESKRAAVVKSGKGREHADLFASRPADIGSVKQTLRPPPPDANGTSARNETSVLFTVDALRGAARVKTPAEPEPAPLTSAFMSSDDEGVIDLKALASTPPKAGARVVAPLFSDPPPAAFAADVSDTGSHRMGSVAGFKLGKRAYAGIAAAAVAVVLCSIGLAAAFKGEEPVARTNAIMAPVVTPPPAVIPPAPVVTTSPAPAAAASSSDDDDKKVSTGKKNKSGGKGGKGGVKASFSKVSSSGVNASQSKPAATPKPADKCGCHGDFNCIIRCTATGH